jgi:fructose-1,6-bisphosphatase-3
MASSIAHQLFSANDPSHFTPQEILALRALAQRFPTIDAAIAEIAHREAVLHLPKGTVHIVSDVHGEYKKLQHILNNASGSLRPLVEEVFDQRLTAEDKQRLLNTIYYPKQMFRYLGLEEADRETRTTFVRQTLRWQCEILTALTWRYSLKHIDRTFPPDYRTLFRELLWEVHAGRPQNYIDTMLRTLTEQHKGLQVVRWFSRVIRNLSAFEVIVAGDLGDRGPRLDKVIDILTHQPRLAIVWGNHDMSWMGACLGHEALIATVLRISLRYRRLSQLEEGFGITMAPLEKLAREVYGNDPTLRFQSRGEGLREAAQMARMQKAMAVIQFKLEAQVIARHPEYQMRQRTLIDQIDLQRGSVTLEGREYPLADTYLPTLDPHHPSVLSPEEAACMDRLKRSFLESQALWEQMRFVAQRGASYLIRDGHLIFHGCLPVSNTGDFLPLLVDGTPRQGRALFEALNGVVHRAFREQRPDDLDMLWYLWTGPLSPMFGKDKMATFESYFIDSQATHKESKNPYFRLIHSPQFCQRVLAEFDVDPTSGLIVNGHVPVKVEQGERPLKDSGQAITIDGAFSEAYGDRGYTLILDHNGTRLAEHYHFESVTEALTQGADIIPRVEEVRRYDQARRVADTEQGTTIRGEIEMLKRLVEAYQASVIHENVDRDQGFAEVDWI